MSKPQRVSQEELEALAEGTGLAVEVDGDIAYLRVRPGREFYASLEPISKDAS